MYLKELLFARVQHHVIWILKWWCFSQFTFYLPTLLCILILLCLLYLLFIYCWYGKGNRKIKTDLDQLRCTTVISGRIDPPRDIWVMSLWQKRQWLQCNSNQEYIQLEATENTAWEAIAIKNKENIQVDFSRWSAQDLGRCQYTAVFTQGYFQGSRIKLMTKMCSKEDYDCIH